MQTAVQIIIIVVIQMMMMAEKRYLQFNVT